MKSTVTPSVVRSLERTEIVSLEKVIILLINELEGELVEGIAPESSRAEVEVRV